MSNSNNGGGPWGGGGDDKGGKDGPWGGGDRPEGNNGGGDNRPPQVPDLDDLVRKGQDQLKVLMGGGRGNGNGSGQGSGGGLGKGPFLILGLVAVIAWTAASFYRVDTSEKSVELFLGAYSQTGTEGLNFAPWPLVTKEVIGVTTERTVEIGVGGRGSRLDQGLMLTGDENIVDINFQVVWNITDPAKFLFNLADPEGTVRDVSESAMREVIGRSNLTPILNTGRRAIASEVHGLIQATLDSYSTNSDSSGSGINILRVNFETANPPLDVIDAVRDVQAAEQERDTLEKRADAYANQRLAAARGESAQMLQIAEGYRAQIVNEATGEASRFLAVYEEYAKAQGVTRKRLYLETMERVLAGVNKIIIDEGVAGESGVVPYLPLNELNRGGSN